MVAVLSLGASVREHPMLQLHYVRPYQLQERDGERSYLIGTYSFEIAMTTLFSPFKLRSLTVPNRIMVAPMCQYSADHGAANGLAFHSHGHHGALRGRNVLHRGDSRRGPGSHHTGLPGPVGRRDRGGAAADHCRHPQALENRGSDATRACRSQGIESRALAGRPTDSPVRRGLDCVGALRRALQGR
jgi:hypothetical protein